MVGRIDAITVVLERHGIAAQECVVELDRERLGCQRTASQAINTSNLSETLLDPETSQVVVEIACGLT